MLVAQTPHWMLYESNIFMTIWMDPKGSTFLALFWSLQKDEHLSMPHPEERRRSRTHVQTLRRIAGRCDSSSSLSAKRFPTRTWPRSQVAGPPCLLLSLCQSRFVRPLMPPFPPEVNTFRFHYVFLYCLQSTAVVCISSVTLDPQFEVSIGMLKASLK